MDLPVELRAGGGEMGARIRAYDWSSSPLGQPAGWPQSLRTVVGLMLDSEQPMFVAWGSELIFLFNDAYAPILGAKRPGALGRPFAELWSDIWSDIGPVVERTLAGKSSWFADLRLVMERHGYPEETYFSFSYNPVRDETGHVAGLFCACTETTAAVLMARQLLATETALRESNTALEAANRQLAAETRHLRQLFEQAPGFITMLRGPEHVFELVNAAYLQLVGHRDLIGKPVREGLPELEGQGFFELLDQVYLSGEALVGKKMPVELQRSPGGAAERRIVDFVFQPILDSSSAVIGIFCEGHDVTERVQAEEALRQLTATLEEQVEERTRERDRLWKLSTDMMLIASLDGSIIAANPACTETLGYTETELRKFRSDDLLHPEDREARHAALAQIKEGHAVSRFEGRYRHKNGSYRCLSLAAVADAGLLYLTGRDITEEKEATETLRQTEEALRQAQKMEAIGQLTGGVAHDFNNLLQVIGANLQLLERYLTPDDQAKRRLEAAVGAVERGAKLSSQLLAFARRQPLEPKAINLERRLEEMDDLLQRSLGAEIALEMSIDRGLWNTFVDPVQVENAILNLALNARDAMPQGGKLTIEAGNAVLEKAYAAEHAEVTPGEYVMLAVSDTGCGMSQALIERAFEPFFTTKEEGRGTGLGLSMVYGFIKQSKGHIKLYSEEGHGTTVRLYLPRAFQTEQTDPEVPTDVLELGTETVLVAEDDPEVREAAVAMLSDLGYRVLKAVDGQSALHVLESGVPVDLLFSDVVMPGPVKAPELAHEAQRVQPDIAVLFTSGYTQNAIIHDGRLGPGVDLLSKPYRREQLARKVRHVLRNREQRLTARRAQTARHKDITVPADALRLRILMVEDDREVLELMSTLVEDLGHEVVACASAEEALAVFDKGAFEVLFTDEGLPGMSGVEFARAALERQPTLRVIIASGYGLHVSIEGLPDANIRFLPKPFDLEEVERTLQSVAAEDVWTR